MRPSVATVGQSGPPFLATQFAYYHFNRVSLVDLGTTTVITD